MTTKQALVSRVTCLFAYAALPALLMLPCVGCSDEGDTGGAEGQPDEDLFVQDLAESEVAPLYDEDAFETFELVLSEKNLKILDDDPTAEKYVEGEMIHDGKSYPAGIRYKGAIGAWYKSGGERCVGEGTFSSISTAPTGPKTCQKLGMKVSFDEYDPEGRFMGMKKVLFHAMNHDTSLMRERLAYELFRDMGVAAPRASHARLLINGEFQGVYAFVEYIDGRFTRSRWSGGEGNLYKEIWPAVTDDFVENTDERLLDALRTNEDPEEGEPSFDGMRGFEQAMADADSDDAQLDAMSQWVDMDYMLRYIAADRATAHDDGILHFYPSENNAAPWLNHNYYWYEAETRDRLWLIPWDMDNAWTPDNVVTRINAAWNDKDAGCETSVVEGLGIAQIPPSCSPVIRAAAHDSLSDKFEEYVAEILDGPLSMEVVDAKIEKWSALIADSVEEASAFEGELTVAGWEQGKAQLRASLEVTRNKLRAMIGRKVVQPDSVTINGLVTLWYGMSFPVQGVSVCLYGHDDVPCVETDANGAYALAGVPPMSEQVLTFTKDSPVRIPPEYAPLPEGDYGLVPLARNYVVPGVNYTEPLMDATVLWTTADPLPLPSAGKGSIGVIAFGSPAGHMLTLTPDPGVDPVYWEVGESANLPNSELTQTTEVGLATLVDIAPGEYHANYDGGCMGFASTSWGLPASDGSTGVRFRVIAGYLTSEVVQICNGPMGP